ncbi:MAG: TetR/AcrR family transcriptional regulator [Gammaproteobacteria bacterium]|nr:TetR/AcrR family transcriptional regulator [Gammaproteobacteria bacterium]MDP2141822.1 TetR/AcrR family transcriptional regulator [Gammaproteobacteria bacterium]MDP2348313.1 TetR/AcrR family transcriptional regulator [Gammaproteobacteria bacterium]
MSTPIDTRLKLMQTATELIWESNYDNVGIAEICKHAGVTKGAFYHHFTSKADLFVSACANDWEHVRVSMDEVLSPRYTAVQQLEKVIGLLLQKQKRSDGEVQICGCPFFTAGAQAGCEEVEVRSAARGMSDNGVLYHTALARNLQAEGYLNRSIDPAQTGRLLFQFVQGLLMHGRVCQDFSQLCQDLREGMYRLLDLKDEYRAVGKTCCGSLVSCACSCAETTTDKECCAEA